MYSATATAAKLPTAPAHAAETSHQLVNAEARPAQVTACRLGSRHGRRRPASSRLRLRRLTCSCLRSGSQPLMLHWLAALAVTCTAFPASIHIPAACPAPGGHAWIMRDRVGDGPARARLLPGRPGSQLRPGWRRLRYAPAIRPPCWMGGSEPMTSRCGPISCSSPGGQGSSQGAG